MSDRPNINAAHRLLTMISAAIRQPADRTQLQVWSEVFKLQGLSGRQQKQAVATGLILMFKELDRIIEQLKAYGHPETTYRELASLLEHNISPEYLGHPWKDFATRLQAVTYPLTIINNFLPDEENPIDPKDFDEVRQELDRLERSLKDKEMSLEVRRFVASQILTIREAMWEYQFCGIRAFHDALLQAFRDYAGSDIPSEHKDDPPIAAMNQIWTRVKEVMATTIKIGGALTAVEKIYQLAEKVGIHHHMK